MFAITVLLGPVPYALLWRNEERAREAQKQLVHRFESAPNEWIEIKDDFGQELGCVRSSIAGHIFEAMEQTKVAHAERALHQHRTQSLAQKMADSDPGLKTSRLMANGPMLHPFPPARN